MIPLIRLCYTLSWSRHQNVVTKFSWDVKEILGLLVSYIYCYGIMFLKQNHAELKEVIHIVLAP